MTIYEAIGAEKPTVTMDELARLQLIDDQHEAVQDVLWNAPDASPIALLIFYAHDGLAVLSGLLSLQEAFDAKQKFDKTGEALVLTMSGPPSGIAKLLRKRKHDRHASIIDGTPPEGTVWVACVVGGHASVAGIPVTPVIPIGSA